MKKISSPFVLAIFLLALIILQTLSPAPVNAIDVTVQDFYGYMNETYGVKITSKAEMGSVANPVLLSKHGIRAQKGDPVEIHDLGDGKVKLVHPKTGKSIIIKPPVKK
ncbi:hypothetical protein [uncultured Desulfobacter sp.]|uniref:hypothetical protein n=1 Tax=uncultured Desulfobacter sp. TaxID=240139 RepID=UPI002AAB477F|nr:hypothetical protein [uncultured Desulfobacter sp.]